MTLILAFSLSVCLSFKRSWKFRSSALRRKTHDLQAEIGYFRNPLLPNTASHPRLFSVVCLDQQLKKKRVDELSRMRGGLIFMCTLNEVNTKSAVLWLCIYVVPSTGFQTFFVQAFKIGVDSWKFSMSLPYISWDDWPNFMISGLNEQLQQELWRRSLTRSHKRTSIGPSRNCWNGRTSAWQPEEITSKGTRV